MPDAYADPIAAFDWLYPTLEKDLKESKMWPIRLAQHKHQEKLRHSHDMVYSFQKYRSHASKETFARSTRRPSKRNTLNFNP